MKKCISTLFFFAVFLTLENGFTETKSNGEVSVSANIYLNSSNSKVGTVKRWKNIGYQMLSNPKTGLTDIFDEDKDELPGKTDWYNKEVQVYATITTSFDPIRSVAFLATAKVDGKFTSDDDPKTIDVPLTNLDQSFSNIIYIETPMGPRYAGRGHEASVSTTITSSTYIITKPISLNVVANGTGEATPTSGGSFSGLSGLPILNVDQSTTLKTVNSINTDLRIFTPQTSDDMTIESEDEEPIGSKCAVPDIGLYGINLVCLADADAGEDYELPGSHYHAYLCFESNCSADQFQWLCYYTPCGHPEYWYVY